MSDVPAHFFRQSAVVPCREDGDVLQALLVTTRRSGRWIVPKGVVEPGLSPERSALAEAWEEAGVRGILYLPALGSFEREKWGGVCRVETFLLEVRDVATKWPEKAARERRWFPLEEARRRVDHPGLGRILTAAASAWQTRCSARRLDGVAEPDSPSH